MATKLKIAKKAVDMDARTVTFHFTDGTGLTCQWSDLPENSQVALGLHGLSQKVGDSYASAESVSDAIGRATDVWDGLRNGDWTVRGEGSTVGILIAAIGNLEPDMDADTIRKHVDGMTDDGRRELKGRKDVAAEMARISADRAMERARKAATDAESATDTVPLGTLF